MVHSPPMMRPTSAVRRGAVMVCCSVGVISYSGCIGLNLSYADAFIGGVELQW